MTIVKQKLSENLFVKPDKPNGYRSFGGDRIPIFLLAPVGRQADPIFWLGRTPEEIAKEFEVVDS